MVFLTLSHSCRLRQKAQTPSSVTSNPRCHSALFWLFGLKLKNHSSGSKKGGTSLFTGHDPAPPTVPNQPQRLCLHILWCQISPQRLLNLLWASFPNSSRAWINVFLFWNKAMYKYSFTSVWVVIFLLAPVCLSAGLHKNCSTNFH